MRKYNGLAICRVGKSYRLQSTASPLSLLSWSLDASIHSHHRCLRRLTFEERLGSIAHTIKKCAADLVLVQDSSPELTSLLAAGEPFKEADTLTIQNIEAIHRYSANAAKSKEHPSEDPTNEAPKTELVEKDPTLPRYRLVGEVRNGKCGYCQTFIKEDSAWSATLKEGMVGLTAVLTSSGVSCQVTNVDLSYRGKSLGQGGQLIASAQVSQQGSPFSMSSEEKGVGGKGTMDPHRELALRFISQVHRSDVVVGNFLLPRNDRFDGYEDAFDLSGRPSHQERTINTFRSHRFDRETNYYYFVPSPGVKKGTAWRETDREDGGQRLGSGKELDMVGTPLPLSAVQNSKGEWIEPHKTLQPLPPLAEGLTPVYLARSEKWIHDHLSDPTDHYNCNLSVPELAGRFQRCYFRYQFQSSPTHPNKHTPFINRYNRRCKVVVAKPFRAVELGELEKEWHHTTSSTSRSSDVALYQCSLSDQYPLFVQLL